MNYYNPYINIIPSQFANNTRHSFFSKLLPKGFSWSGLINGTQKTLNIINQAIPVIKQVSPVVKNAKTMFKVMSEFKRFDTPIINKTIQNNDKTETKEIVSKISTPNNSTPTFFI